MLLQLPLEACYAALTNWTLQVKAACCKLNVKVEHHNASGPVGGIIIFTVASVESRTNNVHNATQSWPSYHCSSQSSARTVHCMGPCWVGVCQCIRVLLLTIVMMYVWYDVYVLLILHTV